MVGRIVVMIALFLAILLLHLLSPLNWMVIYSMAAFGSMLSSTAQVLASAELNSDAIEQMQMVARSGITGSSVAKSSKTEEKSTLLLLENVVHKKNP